MPDPARIDLTLLDVATSLADVTRGVARAAADGYGAIVVPPAFAKRAVELARGTPVEVASVVGYPFGLNKPTIKSIEATSLAKDGLAGLEITPLRANLAAGDLAAMRAELLEVARGARAAEPGLFLGVRIVLDELHVDLTALATAIVQSACDGVTFEARSLDALIAALRAVAGPSLRTKAIAGDAAWIEPLLAAGADRVGHRAG